MSPRILPLILICVSSVFSSKAQEQEKFIPFAKKVSPVQAHQKFYLKVRNDLPEEFNVPESATNHALNNSPLFNCYCSVFPTITPLTKQGTLWTYKGTPNASCTPISTIFTSAAYSPGESPPQDTCSVSNVTYQWSITSGNSIASISGSNTGSTVSVAVSGNGSFTLKLVNSVNCSDSSTCTNSTFYTDSVSTQSCTCTSGPVTIQPSNRQGNVWSYKGNMQGTCTGQYGTSPSLTSCNVQNTIYSWSILAPGGVASLSGPTNGPNVNVAISGNGPYSLRLDVTIICNDAKSCKNYNFYEDSAKTSSPKSCSCNVDVDCERTADQDNLRTYRGVLKGGCTGEYGPSAPYLPCAIKNVNWLWTITDGAGVVEIVGAANQQSVSVRVKGNGAYTLRVQADVECSDGTKSCGEFNFDYCMDSAHIDKKCGFLFTESNFPEMKGGLSESTKKIDKVRRDEFVALIAEGKDFDKVTIECTPSYECDNSQKKSSKEVLLAGKVGFEWEIESGEGNFVKLGFLPENVRSDKGERVIFQTPYVPWPEQGLPPITKTTVIRLRVIDVNGAGTLLDQNVYDVITITTTRRRNQDPDHYSIEIKNIPWNFPTFTLQENNNGVCKAEYGWDKKNDLKKPVIKTPPVADNDKMVLGQWMILEADNQSETDELKMVCESSDCEDDGGKKQYADHIEWAWSIKNDDGTRGRFIGGSTGRFVIYEAPLNMPGAATELTVEIEVRVQNTGVQVNDVPFVSDVFSIKVYRPGVQLEYPPLNWLPEEGISVRLKSYLLYFRGGDWLPALAHMKRIHFFELLDVSTEIGICMNDPLPRRANQCRDLRLKKEGHTEVFQRAGDPPLASNCRTGRPFYVHARSQKPAGEVTISVYSEDYGSYGFLRSFANINQGGRDSIIGELPVYVPVAVAANKVSHPEGRAKIFNYTDNRVTVPRDVDENRIADDGWSALGLRKMKDPQIPRGDDDGQLPADGYAGDGLSNYQEYRGFFISGSHLRTETDQKDLFIHNPENYSLRVLRAALFEPGVGLIRVHEIEQDEYINNDRREINFNLNPDLHYIPVPLPAGVGFEPARVQKGLRILQGPANGNYGATYPLPGFRESPPFWIRRIEVNNGVIRSFALSLGFNEMEKRAQNVAHEVGHSLNIYHHGNDVPGAAEPGFNVGGRQSGNVGCVMRSTNYPPNNPEPVGDIYCDNAHGTGYNTVVPGVPCVPKTCYGNATRGDCIHQIRISCRTDRFPRR